MKAAQKKAGMMDFISYIGKASGIDGAIYTSMDQRAAQQILSLARYLLSTNGQSFPSITAWQFTQPIPFEDGLSEDLYHDLFETIGRDESLIQSFFFMRLTHLGKRSCWLMIPQWYLRIPARYPKPGMDSIKRIGSSFIEALFITKINSVCSLRDLCEPSARFWCHAV